MKGYGCADPDRALDRDMASGLADEAIDHAKTQSGPLADLLGRKEWFERPLQNIRTHTAAGVGHGHGDI